LAGVVNNYNNIIKKLLKCRKNYLIIPQEYFLKMSDVVEVALDAYFNRIRLKDKIELYELDVTSIVQDELDTNYRETVYIRTELLQRCIIKNMLRQCSVHTFTTTYENNPWEKICILSLREYSPLTKIIGYQHAVISRASANMYISKEEMPFIPMPDKVVTTGDITKSMLEKYGSYPNDRIKPSCALRHEYIYKLKKKEFTKNRNILVALEGVNDCYKLVNFVFYALSNTKGFQVIIRTHPARPFHRIKNDLHFDIDSHANFSVSNQKTLKDDLSENDILIYWGSTVSLEALMMGIPVIHVSLDDIINVDPLADCSHLKWAIRNEEELPNAITDIYDMPEHDYLDQYCKAKSYIESYLKKVTDNRLSEFIV
jgi:surface carbohydrate biosynthesis protein (TIGR04326 family)